MGDKKCKARGAGRGGRHGVRVNAVLQAKPVDQADQGLGQIRGRRKRRRSGGNRSGNHGMIGAVLGAVFGPEFGVVGNLGPKRQPDVQRLPVEQGRRDEMVDQRQNAGFGGGRGLIYMGIGRGQKRIHRAEVVGYKATRYSRLCADTVHRERPDAARGNAIECGLDQTGAAVCGSQAKHAGAGDHGHGSC